VRVAPTKVKDEDGILELSLTGPKSQKEVRIATATGELGLATAKTEPAADQGLQYFKIGPYRDKLKIWNDKPAAIHVRNIKRGYWQVTGSSESEVSWDLQRVAQSGRRETIYQT
jgi:hypothetical protein